MGVMTRLQIAILCVSLLVVWTEAWIPTPLVATERRRQHQYVTTRRHSSPPDLQEELQELVDLDAPAGIGGAEFFGGNTEKQEFYDPVAEAKAGLELQPSGVLNRFLVSSGAFDSETTAAIGRTLQEQLSSQSSSSSTSSASISYAPNLTWDSPFNVNSNQPLQELATARNFYRQAHVAITGGRAIADGRDQYELTWEISLLWPIFWEPRILLTGSSRLTVVTSESQQITRQVDTLDHESDVLTAIASQWLPRFWDVYHIGMTPAAELSPRFSQRTKSLLQRYQLQSLPARWYVQASLLDLWDRDDATASMIPNHAFSTVVKTMGPMKQDYTPCSPVQVSINVLQQQQQGERVISWLIPVSVETLAANVNLPLPGSDPEMTDDAQPHATYVFMSRRCVATVPYAGQPQDEDIVAVRKRLYESVVKDGLTPKLDANGRPCFFFWQDTVKACYTPEGLGMAVYEWRPQFTMPCSVGIELEET